ncbi:MAG: peptidoglycan-binding domain-containing protein, partial [Arenimonas sp.]
VKAFQKAHGLVADGDVGVDTFTELKTSRPAVTAPAPSLTINADHSPLLSNPNHPEHALYKQALTGIEKLPATTFKSEQERQNAAASLVFEAKVSGLSKIDTVALSSNGAGLFAVQGAMNDPAHSRIYVDKAQVSAQPIEKSTQQLQQENLLQVQSVHAPELQKKVMMV